MPIVHKRASAKRDLVEQYVYLGEHAGIETAERFLANADASFTDLSKNPGMGLRCPCARRSWPSCANGGLAGLKSFWSSICLARTAFQSCASCMPRRTGGPFLEFYEHRTDSIPCGPPRFSRDRRRSRRAVIAHHGRKNGKQHPMWQQDTYRMIQLRSTAAGIKNSIGNYTFRAAGITTYPRNDGKLERAQTMANHSSPRTTRFGDRREEETSIDEVERIAILRTTYGDTYN